MAGVWGVTPKEIEIKKLFPETKEGARSYFVLGIMEQFVAGIFFVFAFIFWFLIVGKTHTFLTCSAEFTNILDMCADRSMYIMDIIMRLRNFRYAGQVPNTVLNTVFADMRSLSCVLTSLCMDTERYACTGHKKNTHKFLNRVIDALTHPTHARQEEVTETSPKDLMTAIKVVDPNKNFEQVDYIVKKVCMCVYVCVHV